MRARRKKGGEEKDGKKFRKGRNKGKTRGKIHWGREKWREKFRNGRNEGKRKGKKHWGREEWRKRFRNGRSKRREGGEHYCGREEWRGRDSEMVKVQEGRKERKSMSEATKEIKLQNRGKENKLQRNKIKVENNKEFSSDRTTGGRENGGER